LPKPALNEFSAREIQAFAENLEKANQKKEQKRDEHPQGSCTEVKVALMTRLGIPLVRIASGYISTEKPFQNMLKKIMIFLTKFIRILKAGLVSLILLKNILFRNLWYGQ